MEKKTGLITVYLQKPKYWKRRKLYQRRVTSLPSGYIQSNPIEPERWPIRPSPQFASYSLPLHNPQHPNRSIRKHFQAYRCNMAPICFIFPTRPPFASYLCSFVCSLTSQPPIPSQQLSILLDPCTSFLK